MHAGRPAGLARRGEPTPDDATTFSDGLSSTATFALKATRADGSVGAYRLEGLGVICSSQVEGEHAAILGLPLLALLDFLRQQGVLLA